MVVEGYVEVVDENHFDEIVAVRLDGDKVLPCWRRAVMRSISSSVYFMLRSLWGAVGEKSTLDERSESSRGQKPTAPFCFPFSN